MNDQNFIARFDGADSIGRNTNFPPVAPELFFEKAPVAIAPDEQASTATYIPAVLPDDTQVNDNPLVEPVLPAEPITGDTSNSASMIEPVIYPDPSVVIPVLPRGGANIELSGSLLNHEQYDLLRTRWSDIQGKFVDEPRAAVQQADMLVSDVIEQITHVFTTEHSLLESQWNQGNDVSTEDLRQALQHYRTFFNRLVV